MLKENYFGRLVLRNCKIDYFKRKQDDWAENINSNDRKRKMFEEFLDPAAAKASAKAEKQEKRDRKAEKKKEKAARKPDAAMAALGFGSAGASDDGG